MYKDRHYIMKKDTMKMTYHKSVCIKHNSKKCKQKLNCNYNLIKIQLYRKASMYLLSLIKDKGRENKII